MEAGLGLRQAHSPRSRTIALDGRDKRVFEQVRRRMLEGHGFGHGKEYSPWLTLRRGNSSPVSNQIIRWMPTLDRIACYFCRGEYRTALLLLWLGVVDLREQYPIWPISHPHPLDGMQGAPEGLPWSRGLLAIAAEAGIDHGWEVGTRVPYVATIDLLATAVFSGAPQLFAFSLKPLSGSNAPIRWRAAERLELERRYSSEIDSRYHLVNSSLVSPLLAANLELWMECAVVPPRIASARHHLGDFASTRQYMPAKDLVAAFSLESGLDMRDTWTLLRHCAWHHLIDVDPSKNIISSYPLPTGGMKLNSWLKQRLFGGA